MDSSAAWQLAFGIVAALLIFALASGARKSVAIGVLLVLIPFQFIDTRYATSSELIAYTLAAVLLISGGLRFRMVPELAVIVFVYLVSLAMSNRDFLADHAIFIFRFSSCLLVFLLAYNFARLVIHERSIINILLVMNVLVVVYCILQLLAGPGERFVPFGIETFAFNSNRDPGDPRLIGPFGNPGTTAGYFTLMALTCAMELIFARGGRRILLLLVVGANLLGLLATGNRTGLLVLLAMFPMFLYAFRRELGARQIAQYAIGGVAALALASIVAITYTEFGRIFSRLASVTETEQGVPTTRAETWPVAMEKIKQEPWFGEGPHFWTSENAELAGQLQVEFEDLGQLTTAFDPYPHSLYLYLLRTIGALGLVGVIWFFLKVWYMLLRATRSGRLDPYQSAIARLGLLLVPAFLVAQITLEFNRPSTMDYAQFIFALMGLLVGASDRGLPAGEMSKNGDVEQSRTRNKPQYEGGRIAV